MKDLLERIRKAKSWEDFAEIWKEAVRKYESGELRSSEDLAMIDMMLRRKACQEE